MVFTYVQNFSYVKKSPKYIQLERHDDQLWNNFIDELKSSNICEQLQDHVDSNPQTTMYCSIDCFKMQRRNIYQRSVCGMIQRSINLQI